METCLKMNRYKVNVRMRELLKKSLIVFDWIFIKLQSCIISLFTKEKEPSQFVINYICKAAATKERHVFVQIKPKDTTEIPILSGLEQSHSFAIVMQGPVCIHDDMTYNTVKFYKQTYPHAAIIVSTWNDEPTENIARLTEQGAIIVRSEKPVHNGLMNVNYQLTNSLAGVKKAKELGCEFAVKTRTDQRICKPFIFDAMLSSINMFPSISEKQRGRVVTLSNCHGGMFIPYHICDFLYLGHTEDLIRLFSSPLDQRKIDSRSRRDIGLKTRRECSAQMLDPEVYIMKHYCMDVLGLCCEATVESYWHVVKNYLICYSMKDVDLMWNKYDRLSNLNYFTSAYFGKNDTPERLLTMGFDFFNWLNLYMGNIKYDTRYERYADVTLFTKRLN